MKKTCLHGRHLLLGAKMSPFAGYDMPIQYSGIIDEHNAVRHSAGMFDVSHMGEIFVSGKDAGKFVDHIFTGEAAGIPAGKIVYGMMLYPDGGTVDDLLVYRESAPDSFLLVVNAANIDKDYEWMLSNAEGYEVTIDNRSSQWGQIAVQGPEAEKYVAGTLGFAGAAALGFYEFADECVDGTRVIVSRTGYTGEDGFEIYCSHELIRSYWDKLVESGRCKPCGLGCRDTLRFEVGLPLYGNELSKDISPVMAGLSMFCKLDKEEFIGKEAVAAQKANGVSRKVVGIELHEHAVPRHGYNVVADGNVIGTVTTGYQSISTHKSVCMALVDAAYSKLGTELEVQIRKKTFAGTVVKKRFYDKHYKK